MVSPVRNACSLHSARPWPPFLAQATNAASEEAKRAADESLTDLKARLEGAAAERAAAEARAAAKLQQEEALRRAAEVRQGARSA